MRSRAGSGGRGQLGHGHVGIIPAVPPVLLVLAGIASVQVGAALAKSLFDEIGSGGTVFIRVLAAAVVLALIWPPRLKGRSRRELGLALAFGGVLAAMNLTFYASIDRLPLGIAVTLEFVGPLGVAVFGSRKPLDLAWVALAAAGILLLSDFGGGGLDTLGVALALAAGGFWAAYIVLSARVGKSFPGATGLSLAMLIAVVPLAPVGIADAGAELLVPWILLARRRRGDPVVGDPLRARDGGAAPAAHRGLRRADEPRARGGSPGWLPDPGRGPGRARARGDRPRGGGKRGRPTRRRAHPHRCVRSIRGLAPPAPR